jgi:hypothetical protein
VHPLVTKVFNQGRVEVAGQTARAGSTGAGTGVDRPFRASFSDLEMEGVELVGEGHRAVARFACSATHTRSSTRSPRTHRTFQRALEVYFFILSCSWYAARSSGRAPRRPARQDR